MPMPTDNPRMPNWLLQNRNFVLLWAAYFIAAAGDNLNDLGQLKLLEAMQGEESTRLMALMMFGLFVPYIVFGPLAGWFADRFSRKWTMISADVARAAVVINFGVLIPLLLKWGCGSFTVMLTQMSLGVLAAFFSPARQAMLPTLVRSDQLVRANGMIGAIAPIGAMIGFLVGGYIVESIGAQWNFRINGMTYCLSALLILAIIPPKQHRLGRAPHETVFGPLLEGFAYVRGHLRVAQMILLGALFWGAAGVVYSCVPAIVKELVSDSYADVGNYRALPAVGMVIGAIFMSTLGPWLGIQRAVLMGLGGAGAGLIVMAVAFAQHWSGGSVAACLVAVGVAGAMLLVTINATIQRLVPNTRRGRVFGVSDMTMMGAMVLATGSLGLTPIPNLDRYVPAILGLTAAGMLGAGGVAMWLYSRQKRASV